MQSMLIRIFLILTLFTLFNPLSLLAATEKRIALVIGNSNYDAGRLKNPMNDSSDMSVALKKSGFFVILKKDVGHKEMETAIREFGHQLKKGDVGLFYYAGHAVQIEGSNFLIPIGANIEEEGDVKYKAVDLNHVLDVMGNAGNKLSIIILDACRDNPYAKSFRSSTRGLAIVGKSPSDTLIAYSTSPGQTAMDGSGRNSPYTRALLDNMAVPGLSVEQIFKKVRNDLVSMTNGKQRPWYMASLGVDFYFNTPEIQTAAMEKSAKINETGETAVEPLLKEQKDNYDVAMVAKPQTSPTVTEIGRDGRFVAYSDGTVLDTGTDLMWAAKDNGNDINWMNAKIYCKNYRGGGYTDWRLPTQEELAGLYDKSKPYKTSCGWKAHLTELIRLTCNYLWASETRFNAAASFNFAFVEWPLVDRSYEKSIRALPVRSCK